MARTNNSIQSNNSRYVQGGQSYVYPKRIGWWERRNIPFHSSDRLVTIQPQEVGRPDRLANRVYGKSGFQWLVLLYNNIVDINTEFVHGKILRVPSQQRVALDIMTRPTGGKRATQG